jgi:hypothetical protein
MSLLFLLSPTIAAACNASDAPVFETCRRGHICFHQHGTDLAAFGQCNRPTLSPATRVLVGISSVALAVGLLLF